jgi:hypothetical protein
MVRGAKAMPMSASCLVNRAEMIDILERLREELPADLDHAIALLSRREAVLGAGHEEAERIRQSGRGERELLIEQTDVLVEARARATTVTTQARSESARLLADADDYVDRKLADFEVLLGQLTSQVNNGRLRLSTRREAGLTVLQTMADEAVHGAARQDGGPADVLAESDAVVDPEGVEHRGPAVSDVFLPAR